MIAQKVVSKAEGRVVALSEVKPSDRAEQIAAELDKDPALVQLVLDESSEVLRAERGVLICETRQGLVCANAGVDTSNVGEGRAVLLPVDPDASARRIRAELERASGKATAVVVSDSFGRAWRRGQSEVAIGCAGLRPLDDWRGRTDAGGKQLSATTDRDCRRGGGGRRSGPRQGKRRAGGDRARTRRPPQRRRRPRCCGAAPPPRGGPVPLGPLRGYSR